MRHDIRLHGFGFRLEPLNSTHIEPLWRLLDEQMWAGMVTEFPVDAAALSAQLLAAVDTPGVMVFAAVEERSGMVVGCTRYYDHVPAQRRLEIGTTFYSREWWGSHLNPACKWLLFDYAFAKLDIYRVALRCDVRNTRSAAAIERLGATPEGILRGHRIDPHGEISDTAYFSVLQPEWPEVRGRLLKRLDLATIPDIAD
ncbi:RimJ/RimL family protein N-acetyltransferase [Antricoccus suffuscus]|uniref:RimJ/RimL family protein N-acetyltransferase n=1 Tax=Antricoccus suffuscus TaxID=1629062 RepID=A0A2T1A0R5_9ACTN|nr:GNAT family protein [Antricoccus suffuscus]PRZ42200.1 RimJ/RimL family protein N-acetyltransferase [Antricoccus suffuscus]